ncbi:hypothetical protein E4T56_gene2315 [Termitomyces sp. T112]|nr:hypothetical protein E4T56_gene2315 [Termitomyces sp. T112]KAH0590460.1 hypothetical protein H2248_000609 [Termitomyces sp. 'cryptogamus']
MAALHHPREISVSRGFKSARHNLLTGLLVDGVSTLRQDELGRNLVHWRLHGLYLSNIGTEHSVIYDTAFVDDGNRYIQVELTKRNYWTSDSSLCPVRIELLPHVNILVQDIESLIQTQSLNVFVTNYPNISGCRTFVRVLLARLEAKGWIPSNSLDHFDSAVGQFIAAQGQAYWVADEAGAGPVQ